VPKCPYALVKRWLIWIYSAVLKILLGINPPCAAFSLKSRSFAPPMTPIDPLLHELPSHMPRLWRFALRLARNTHDAQDLMQQSYLRAIERRHQWQPATSLISWLFAIMYSQWINELRSPQRRRQASFVSTDDFEAEGAPEPAASLSVDPEFALMCKQVVESVGELPEAQRLVMILVAVEGLSYREAADVLDVPIGTVMSRLARARLVIGERFLEGRAGAADKAAKATGRAV
jgi:RNA polymerase sigma-70 factor, ECF subfamily